MEKEYKVEKKCIINVTVLLTNEVSETEINRLDQSARKTKIGLDSSSVY